MTKLSLASSGGFSPSSSTLKGGAPGSSNLRVCGWAKALEHAKAAIKSAIIGLSMGSLVVSFLGGARVTVLVHPIYPILHRSALRRGGSPRPSTFPLPSRWGDRAGLPGHDRLTRLLERLKEQLRRLGARQGNLPVDHEERDARHAEAARLLLTGPDSIQPLVADEQLLHLGPV